MTVRVSGLRVHSPSPSPRPHTLKPPSPRTLKRREQKPLSETEDEIEDMDDPDWGPGDF